MRILDKGVLEYIMLWPCKCISPLFCAIAQKVLCYVFKVKYHTTIADNYSFISCLYTIADDSISIDDYYSWWLYPNMSGHYTFLYMIVRLWLARKGCGWPRAVADTCACIYIISVAYTF